MGTLLLRCKNTIFIIIIITNVYAFNQAQPKKVAKNVKINILI